MGWALIRGRAPINFFCLYDGHLFEVGANSRLGAYSSKYSSTNLCKSFFYAKCCMMSTMSIFFGYVSVRTGAILNLEGKERLGRDPFTPFRRPSYDLVTKPFANCCCFQSLDELGLMDYLGNKSSKLIKVITAVFDISARHKVEGQL